MVERDEIEFLLVGALSVDGNSANDDFLSEAYSTPHVGATS